jgi:predicted HicB family RNase H-like nuclease
MVNNNNNGNGKKIEVSVPKSLNERLEDYAEEKGVSVNSVARESIS